MPAHNLADCLQHNGLENVRTVYGEHRAPNAVPSIMGLDLCLTPLITGSKKVDDLVNFADTIVGCKSGAIERHGFSPLPETRHSTAYGLPIAPTTSGKTRLLAAEAAVST